MRSAVLTLAILAVAGCTDQPPRIIHICDFHYVSREYFAADLRDQAGEPATEAEIAERYAEFLDSVETVQNEQTAILRDLIRERGIHRVFKEGVTAENIARFRVAVDELPDFDIPELHRLMLETEDADERALLLVTIEEHRAKRLEIGAIGRLLDSRELADVVPLEDRRLLEAADPTRNGFRFDGRENAARELDIARRLLAAGPVAVVILGGGHDLAEEIRALNPRAVYQRVEPEAWRRAVVR